MERGDPEPRLAAARLGVRGGAAQRRPDRHRPSSADDERRGRGHRSSATACSSPASRCSCSRPCRPRCSPGSADSPRAASSTSSATASGGCCTSCSPSASSARVGRVRARPVRDQDRLRRRARPAARWRCWRSGSALYMLALALAQAVIALQGHALVAARLGRRRGRVRPRHVAVAATTCSGGSRSAWWPRRSPRWSCSPVACGTSCQSAPCPTSDSCSKPSPTCPWSPERSTHLGERFPELLTQTITK